MFENEKAKKILEFSCSQSNVQLKCINKLTITVTTLVQNLGFADMFTVGRMTTFDTMH